MPFLVIGNLLATVLLVVACLSAVPANNLGLLYIGTSCCGGRIAHIVQRIENYFAINFQLSVRQCALAFCRIAQLVHRHLRHSSISNIGRGAPTDKIRLLVSLCAMREKDYFSFVIPSIVGMESDFFVQLACIVADSFYKKK